MKECYCCGYNKFKETYKLTFSIRQCVNCGLEYAEGIRVSNSFISDMDENERIKALRSLRILNSEIIIKEMRNLFGNEESKNGLDVGCAQGWFLEVANRAGYNTEGIEPDSATIKKINGEYNIYIGYFPKDMPPNKKYDFIIFNDVFEHIPDSTELLKGCSKLLSDNGFLIINIPMRSGFFSKLGRLLYACGKREFLNRLWQFNFHSPHLYYYNRDNLIKIVEKNNFSFIKYRRLKTIDFHGIQARIAMDKKNGKVKQIAITLILMIMYPFIEYIMPPDIGLFVFKKN